jgi:hypothetical protein
MIYPTVKECMDTCSKTGVLKIEGLRNDEYILKSAGFTPRYSRDLERVQGSKTLAKAASLKTSAKAAAFFSLIPIVILL